MFGYIDESGAPGKATHKKDCLVVSLVVFDSMEVRDKAARSIEKLRSKLNLPCDYEFHCSSNSTKPQREFLNLLANLKFRFISVVAFKNDTRKTASYANIAKILVREIENNFGKLNVKMDSNPTLHTALSKELRKNGLRAIRVQERKSHSESLIQVADYVANISSKRARKTRKADEWYAKIARKEVSFIEMGK